MTGQGSNNAAHCAARYLRAITERGEAPFDEAWMRSAHASFWDHARHTVDFTNTMLAQPLPDHIQQVMTAAASRPEVAHRFANGYANPGRPVRLAARPGHHRRLPGLHSRRDALIRLHRARRSPQPEQRRIGGPRTPSTSADTASRSSPPNRQRESSQGCPKLPVRKSSER
ncbi:hypothetical protein STANM309S_04345 [Streptomyces tanashiensis]